MELNLRITDPDADDEILEERTRRLRQELLETDVDDVRLDRSGVVPPGGKGDPVTIGALIVSLTSSAAAAAFVTGSLRVLRAWIERRAGRTVIVDRNGHRVELKGGSAEEDERLLRLLLDEGADAPDS